MSADHWRREWASPVEQREVPDPVIGQAWTCRVQSRMPNPAARAGDTEWLEHVICRHERMLVALELPLGELGRLTDEALLQRIVEARRPQRYPAPTSSEVAADIPSGDMRAPTRVGMPWYRPEDYARVRAICTDGRRLPESYELWLAAALEAEREVGKAGGHCVRAIIDPEAFPAWCAGQSLQPNGFARARFADLAARATEGHDTQ